MCRISLILKHCLNGVLAVDVRPTRRIVGTPFQFGGPLVVVLLIPFNRLMCGVGAGLESRDKPTDD
jgi:hypothetical protein